jgi:hypothetical protein
MPFTLTGVLKKVVIEPGKSGLTASDEGIRDASSGMRAVNLVSRIP